MGDRHPTIELIAPSPAPDLGVADTVFPTELTWN
jgi:hypothetical protein